MTAIRPAQPRDAPAIAAIVNQIIRDTTITFNSVPKTPQDITDALIEADAYLVAETGGDVVGFASFGPFRTGIGYASVKEHSICLAPEARASGLGAALLGALENVAKAQGVTHMVAGVSGENPAGLKFHAKHGYDTVGQMPGIGHKFGRRLDLVLMQKTL